MSGRSTLTESGVPRVIHIDEEVGVTNDKTSRVNFQNKKKNRKREYHAKELAKSQIRQSELSG